MTDLLPATSAIVRATFSTRSKTLPDKFIRLEDQEDLNLPASSGAE